MEGREFSFKCEVLFIVLRRFFSFEFLSVFLVLIIWVVGGKRGFIRNLIFDFLLRVDVLIYL